MPFGAQILLFDTDFESFYDDFGDLGAARLAVKRRTTQNMAQLRDRIETLELEILMSILQRLLLSQATIPTGLELYKSTQTTAPLQTSSWL